MQNELGKFGAKIFSHYTDIAIFVMQYLQNRPVYKLIICLWQ